MPVYPLPTLAPTITSAGITAPVYADIYQSLVASYQLIYGADVVLTADTQDGQWIGVIAQAISDSNAAAITVFNSFSPSNAQGAALSSLVKINGIARQAATYTTVDVLVTGTVGTIITNGVVSDGTYQYALPPTVTIPTSADITVTATCTTIGAITAPANTVTMISTPTLGWISVTNPSAATAGVAVQSDAQLRARQALSTEIPAVSPLDAIIGALLNVSGVTNLAAHENQTSVTDSFGVPSHTVWFVVQGGSATTIAQTIAQNKTPGTGTYGSISEVVIDQYGIPTTIKFDVPTIETIMVNLSIHALPGYTAQIGNNIIAGIVSYINGLTIGENVYLTQVIASAIAGSGAPNTFNLTALTQAVSPGSPTASDITLLFNQLATTTTANVTLSLI